MSWEKNTTTAAFFVTCDVWTRRWTEANVWVSVNEWCEVDSFILGSLILVPKIRSQAFSCRSDVSGGKCVNCAFVFASRRSVTPTRGGGTDSSSLVWLQVVRAGLIIGSETSLFNECARKFKVEVNQRFHLYLTSGQFHLWKHQKLTRRHHVITIVVTADHLIWPPDVTSAERSWARRPNQLKQQQQQRPICLCGTTACRSHDCTLVSWQRKAFI